MRGGHVKGNGGGHAKGGGDSKGLPWGILVSMGGLETFAGTGGASYAFDTKSQAQKFIAEHWMGMSPTWKKKNLSVKRWPSKKNPFALSERLP